MKEAAGYVLLSPAPSGWQVLLLRNARHRTWGFPKGHLDGNESPRDGAAREVLEETGIRDFVSVDGFEAVTIYKDKFAGSDALDPEDVPEKRVRYFLATVETPTLKRSREHDAGGWMLPEEAATLLAHEDLRRVLRDALARVRGG